MYCVYGISRAAYWSRLIGRGARVGCRYELYCIARALGTSCTTVHCEATLEQIAQMNRAGGTCSAAGARSTDGAEGAESAAGGAGAGAGPEGEAAAAGEGRYEAWILKELPQRYERPNDRNRWERPLFVVPRPDPRARAQGRGGGGRRWVGGGGVAR